MDPFILCWLAFFALLAVLALCCSDPLPSDRLPFGSEPMSDRLRQELVDAAAKDL